MASSGFSMKISKTSGQKLQTTSKIREHDDDRNEADSANLLKKPKISLVTSIDSSGINVIDDDVDKDAPLIIPPLANKLVFNLEPKTDEERLNLLARQAILEDAFKSANGETVNVQANSLTIKSQENRSGLDLADLGDDADEADYESIPVESFGKALLRGLGWSEGQPIGKRVQKVVKPVVTAPRPKGLGLGAERPKPAKNEKLPQNGASAEKEELTMKIGAYVKTKKKSEYGEVLGLDEDNARCMVKFAISKSTENVSQHSLVLVDKIEYEKFSKVLNKEKLDRLKEEENNGHHYDEKSKSEISTNLNILSNSWLCKGLRVRIIDKTYEKGKYYKEKVIISKIINSAKNCRCKNDNGDTLENLKDNQLETVIPKRSGDTVLIVDGKYRGKLAIFLEKDSKRSKASVKFSDGSTTWLNFDDICEYVGDQSLSVITVE